MMKAKLLTLGLGLALGSSLMAQAQNHDLGRGAYLDGKTIVKTDVVGAVTSSYHLAVERILSKRFSLQLSYTLSPWREPNSSWLLIKAKKPAGVEDETLRRRHNSLNLDLRIYTGRSGYGEGFYLSPYVNYSIYRMKDGIHKDYPNYRLSEKEYGLGYGLGLGFQWYMGRNNNIVVDASLLGVHRSSKFTMQESAVFTGEGAQFRPEESEGLGSWMLEAHKYSGNDLEHLKSSEGGRRLEVESTPARYFFRANLRIGIRF